MSPVRIERAQSIKVWGRLLFSSPPRRGSPTFSGGNTASSPDTSTLSMGCGLDERVRRCSGR